MLKNYKSIFYQMESRCGLCQGSYDPEDEHIYPHSDLVPSISLASQINIVISGDSILRPHVDSTQIFTQVLLLTKRIGSIGRNFES
jgi:hypothetical protein